MMDNLKPPVRLPGRRGSRFNIGPGNYSATDNRITEAMNISASTDLATLKSKPNTRPSRSSELKPK
ncbi:hypothetical protein CEQ90_18895 [Lewinellaceae bacterium SD302]|nr:hypothetical protein CEQ90_18895 [Lewinellaceae bacterium SD302]